MNISEGFIKRPIATSLLMAAIAMFGLVAYQQLPVSDLPNVDFPTLLVTAQLPGAGPETMASSVATPLENQFSMIAGMQSMTSVNSLGSTQITLEFDLNRPLDGAAVDVQSAITQASRLLPQGMPTPPTFTKVNPADQPILYLVITSTTLPPWTLDEYAQTRIAQRISMVNGVAQVQVLGSQKYAASACGSSCAWTAYFCEPRTCTCATPLTIEMRCAMRVCAYSSSVHGGSVVDVTTR